MSNKENESNNLPSTIIESDSAIKIAVNEELNRVNHGTSWMWKLFLICALPNILNGFHVSSYVFLGQMPDSYWCIVPDLMNSGWNAEEIKNVTSRNIDNEGSSCDILDIDYNKLSKMSYEEALKFTNNSKLGSISCKTKQDNYFHYDQEPDISIVPEWNLVCDKTVLRSTVQVALSVGKLIGASISGLISDKYGRKKSFIFGTVCYITGSLLATVSPWYWLFILGRIGIGMASSGLFYSSYTIISENVSPKYRSWLCLGHSISYPIGMLILALSAYLVHPWRYLQLTLSIPALLLIMFCYLMFESPRWLLSKGREIEAYRIMFKKEPDFPLIGKNEKNIIEQIEEKQSISFSDRIKGALNEYISLYGESNMRKRALICHFNWCVSSMSYYITALNAHNFAANKYIYVAITGCVDAPGYLVSMIIVRYTGRKVASCFLFVLAGLALLIVLVIPKDSVSWLVFFAMFGRFGISAAYAVTTLHTSEMFPTDIRNSALGASSTISHVGAISAPYIVDLLGLIAWYIPTTICGVSVLIAGFLTTFQPETKDRILKDHVAEELHVECKQKV